MTSEFIRCPECDGYNCGDGCAYPGTRATPSVDANPCMATDVENQECQKLGRNTDTLAGLVRWKHCEYPNQHKMMEHKDGEYVLHSEAAKVVAMQAEEIEKLKEQNDKFKWQVRETCTRAETAEAELAQIKAQEPVAYKMLLTLSSTWRPAMTRDELIEKHKKSLTILKRGTVHGRLYDDVAIRYHEQRIVELTASPLAPEGRETI